MARARPPSFNVCRTLLSAQGHDVLALREPGGTALGEVVRGVVLEGRGAMDERAELLLFCASRAQLVAERIQPHLAAGGVVLCDRYADSTLAYQGYGRGLDLAVLRGILDFATRLVRPDLTIYFKIEAEAGLRRRAVGGGVNRLDAENLAFHQRVCAGYAALISEDPDRWAVIDAGQGIDAVSDAVRVLIAGRVPGGNTKN